MRAKIGPGRKTLDFRWCALFYLGTQMRELELQLTARNSKARAVANWPNAGPAETIATCFRFRGDLGEVAVDCGERSRMATKAIQLRMMTVASRCSAEYGSRKETFAPHCDEGLTIEI